MARSIKSEEPTSASWIGIVVLFSRLLLTTLIRACTYPLVKARGNGATTYFRDVMYAMIRKKLESQTIAQYRLLDSLTPDVYRQWVRLHGLDELTEQLDVAGAQAHWTGSRDANRLIVYFHGGGYTQALQPGYFDYLKDLKDLLGTADISVSVVVLSYTLAPEAKFPTQLAQGISLLRRLVHDEQKDPSSMILMGDSAGGNLLLALISHMLHPLPNIPALTLARPFRAVVLMSPWVSFQSTSTTYTTNVDRDVLCIETLHRWSKLFYEHTPAEENYAEPLPAASSWWANGSKVASKVAIWAGEHEVFLSDVVAFSDKLKTGWSQENFELMIGPKEVHCQPLVDVMMQMRVKTNGALQLEQFLRAVVK